MIKDKNLLEIIINYFIHSSKIIKCYSRYLVLYNKSPQDLGLKTSFFIIPQNSRGLTWPSLEISCFPCGYS